MHKTESYFQGFAKNVACNAFCMLCAWLRGIMVVGDNGDCGGGGGYVRE